MSKISGPTIFVPPTTDAVAVYDYDDILWPLAERICQSIGFPIEKWTEFDIDLNPFMTPRQRDLIYEAFTDPKTFREINFYPEVAEIMKVLELGVRPRIVSNSCARDVLILKIEQILAAVPELKESDLEMRLVTRGSAEALGKTIPPNALTLVDDSPLNFRRTTARYNILMRWPWNSTVAAQQLVAHDSRDKPYGTKYFWEDGLGAANARVYRCVKEHLALTQCAV